MASAPNVSSSDGASWAAPGALIAGLIGVASGVAIFVAPDAAGFLFFIPPLSAIGGLTLARIARGPYPRWSPVRWPGRAMALLGAILSWVLLAAGVLLFVLVAIVLGNGP